MTCGECEYFSYWRHQYDLGRKYGFCCKSEDYDIVYDTLNYCTLELKDEGNNYGSVGRNI
jgi:hypothetical protein